ncbi:MAG: hypothetical protein IT161_12215, partial [Bryobacterales bacterium]|nr:hypothetical protein [Bryobacterales bacterium]
MLRTLLALVLSTLLAAQQPGQAPVFTASANLVIVTVFARDRNGRPVENL